MSEWKTQKLGEVCKIEKKKYNGSNLAYVGMEDIESNTGRFLGSKIPKSVKSSTFKFTSEHILYGRLRPYLNKVMLPDFEGHCSSEIFPIKVSKELDRSFLFYWLTQKKIILKIDETCTGTRMPRANMEKVLNFSLVIPPIEEQKRIVQILDKAFEGIAQAEANTRRNLINARELFDSYLNQVFTKHDQNWTQEPLGKVCTLQRGYDLPQRLRVEGKFPLVSSSGIIDSHQEAKVKAPGVVTGRSGSIGSLFYVKENFWPLNTVLYVKDFHENDPEFIFYLLKHFNLGKYASGAGVPTLNRNHVHSVLVKKPIFIEEQKNLVKSLNKLQEYQKRLETIYQRKLEAIAELKQSILEKAFTGQLSQ
jgi:type I restriction enzyme S subunit